MGTLSNYHAHSTFCDGAETPEAMVQAAIAKGFSAFGISGHAYMGFDTCWSMTPSTELEFVAEMSRLKKVYEDRILLLTGLERDYYSPEPGAVYDYVIGSVHMILKEGNYLSVDNTAEEQVDAVTRYYGGDFYAYTRDYYRLVAELVPKTKPDIIGHFDLVTKFNEGGHYFDESDPRYLGPALEALKAVTEQQKLFEINTGAMYRVGKTNPYPSPSLLKALRDVGGDIMLSSDSHDIPSLGYKFKEVTALALSCGFKSAKMLTADGFVDYKL